jgi:hypothetical protein
MIRLLVSWIPEHEGPRFVMTQPNLDSENIIVSKNGDMLGIIGWTGVNSVPRTLGKERYPRWLKQRLDFGGILQEQTVGRNKHANHG